MVLMTDGQDNGGAAVPGVGRLAGYADMIKRVRKGLSCVNNYLSINHERFAGAHGWRGGALHGLRRRPRLGAAGARGARDGGHVRLCRGG
jgi:hypothetical protein